MEHYLQRLRQQLPDGIRIRRASDVNGLDMMLLEAGDEQAPCIVLLHGFPELAFSWRKVMMPLAEAGFRVIAPEQRGYGGTASGGYRFDDDLQPFRMLNLVRDLLAMLAVMQVRTVALLAGHDFGSPVAAWSALTRPDIFQRVALMSAPFAGPPGLPLRDANSRIHDELRALPRPRRHYQWYYSTRSAEADMLKCPQGLEAFLRAYYHVKSADWPENRPHPLAAWSAGELAKLPTYYVMNADEDMARTCAPHLPDPASIAACQWLTDDEVAVYASAFRTVGLQGGLNWYRCGTNGWNTADFSLFAGRRIDVPSMFIAGSSDWGVHQRPGDFNAMASRACSDFRGAHLLDGAGHWVQQEQAHAVADLLTGFARS